MLRIRQVSCECWVQELCITCQAVIYLAAGQTVGASFVEAYAQHRPIMAPERESFIDREAVLVPGRGQHVIGVKPLGHV